MSTPLIVTLVVFQMLMNPPRLFVFQHFGPAPSKLKGDVIVASTGLHAPATPLDVAVAVGRAVAVAVAAVVAVAVGRAVTVAVAALVAVAVARAVVAVAVGGTVDVAVAAIVGVDVAVPPGAVPQMSVPLR